MAGPPAFSKKTPSLHGGSLSEYLIHHGKDQFSGELLQEKISPHSKGDSPESQGRQDRC